MESLAVTSGSFSPGLYGPALPKPETDQPGILQNWRLEDRFPRSVVLNKR